MSLRLKMIVLLILALIPLEAGLYFTVSRVLLKDFAALEAKTVEGNVERALRAIGAEYAHLSSKTSDWAGWDDTYTFIKDGNKSYVQSNLTLDAMVGLQVQYILYFGPDGSYRFGRAVDPQTQEFRAIPDFVKNLFPVNAEFIKHGAEDSSKAAGFLLPDGYVLMSSMPILTSNHSGPIRGTLVFGKYLSSDLIKQLAAQAKLNLSAWLVNQPDLPDQIRLVQSNLRAGAKYYREVEDEQNISGYGLLYDFFGQPAMVIGVSLEREIYQQGLRSIGSMAEALVVSGLIFGCLVLILIERSILYRLLRLNNQVSVVAKTGDSTVRVENLGRDELGSLSASINTMLDTLESVQAVSRNAKEAAERANNSKSQFVANISHEIRTPINGIMGMTQVMLNNEKNGDTREYLKMVIESAASLLAVINDLLDISKVEAGKLTLDPGPMEVRQVIREALQAVSLKAYEKGLELIADVDPAVPRTIECDSLRLRQILINLIGNSIKFTEQGQIVVKVATLGKDNAGALATKFSIIDSGIGIPAHKLGSVFEAFTQADGSTARKYGGTGLGLTITRELVEMMGGKIGVQSEVGRGSVFSFNLDLKPIAQSYQSSVTDSSRYKDIDLLLVDDNPLIRGTLVEHLSSLGINVVSVADQESAVAAFEAVTNTGFPFKFLILDSILGQDQGLKLLSTIRQRWPDLDTNIIAMIPCHKLDERQSYRELGASRIVSKPLMSEDVSNAIDVLLGLVEEEAESGGVLSQSSSSPDKSLEILVADDVKVNQKVLRLMLEHRGHQIKIAENGRQVIEILRSRGHFNTGSGKIFDLILMDVQMPELDGVLATELIRELEDLNHCKHIPIIAVTANATQTEREHFLQSGMDGVLSKPIDPANLYRLMAEYGSTEVVAPQVERSPLGREGFEGLLRQRLGLADLTSVIDTESLFNRFADDNDLVLDVIGSFIEEWPALLASLRLAVTSSEALKVRKAAHAIKGSLGNVSAVSAWHLANEMEHDAAAGKISSEKFDLIEKALAELNLAFTGSAKTRSDADSVHSEQRS